MALTTNLIKIETGYPNMKVQITASTADDTNTLPVKKLSKIGGAHITCNADKNAALNIPFSNTVFTINHAGQSNASYSIMSWGKQ